ncbi:MAG: hypothetical protein JO199_02640 [Candidatus Eremiobacteraeota bacterium]|nr:hypothetical protein [Candidatus Eremiobacteraeota bacterium]
MPIVATIAWAIVLPIGALLAITSPMMFDSGATDRTWTLFYTALALPASCVVSIVGLWLVWGISKVKTPLARVAFLLVAALPLVPILIFVVMFSGSGSLT